MVEDFEIITVQNELARVAELEWQLKPDSSRPPLSDGLTKNPRTSNLRGGDKFHSAKALLYQVA